MLAGQVVLAAHQLLLSTSSPQMQQVALWCAKINRASNDRLKCQVEPSMLFGDTPPPRFEQARDGVADIHLTVPGDAAGRLSSAQVVEPPCMAATANGTNGSNGSNGTNGKALLDDARALVQQYSR